MGVENKKMKKTAECVQTFVIPSSTNVVRASSGSANQGESQRCQQTSTIATTAPIIRAVSRCVRTGMQEGIARIRSEDQSSNIA